MVLSFLTIILNCFLKNLDFIMFLNDVENFFLKK